jgi:hypothetical protein
MESKNKKIKTIYLLILLCIGCFPLQSCWTGDAEFNVKDVLTDNFQVVEDPANLGAGILLVQNFEDGLYETIEEHCQEIYFDSVSIYVKSFSNPPVDSSFRYHHIKILSNEGDDKKTTLENQELSLSEFNKKVGSCKSCSKKNY